MKSAEVGSGLAEWIGALVAVATLYPEQMKKQAFPEGEIQAAVLNNGRFRSTVQGQRAALLGTGTCGDEAFHAELRGVFQAGV